MKLFFVVFLNLETLIENQQINVDIEHMGNIQFTRIHVQMKLIIISVFGCITKIKTRIKFYVKHQDNSIET